MIPYNEDTPVSSYQSCKLGLPTYRITVEAEIRPRDWNVIGGNPAKKYGGIVNFMTSGGLSGETGWSLSTYQATGQFMFRIRTLSSPGSDFVTLSSPVRFS